MLKILYQLDDSDNIEANLVAEAANRLAVGEFQFFCLAHEAWFGLGVDPKQIEAIFISYMIHDQVPHYVRHYARATISRDDAGGLDLDAEDFHRFDAGTPAPGSRLKGAWTVGLVVAFTAVFMALLLYSYRPAVVGEIDCNYPPCPHVQ
jgi:hypothetical protein